MAAFTAGELLTPRADEISSSPIRTNAPVLATDLVFCEREANITRFASLALVFDATRGFERHPRRALATIGFAHLALHVKPILALFAGLRTVERAARAANADPTAPRTGAAVGDTQHSHPVETGLAIRTGQLPHLIAAGALERPTSGELFPTRHHGFGTSTNIRLASSVFRDREIPIAFRADRTVGGTFQQPGAHAVRTHADHAVEPDHVRGVRSIIIAPKRIGVVVRIPPRFTGRVTI